MADLPVPTPNLVTAQDPHNMVSGGDVQRSADYLAQGGDKLAQGLSQLSGGLDKLDVPLAEQAGRNAVSQAVTRNADGSLNVTTPANSFILGQAGDAYAATVTAGVGAALRTQMDADFTNMRQQHQGDAGGFQQAAGTYIDTLSAKNPGEIGSMVQQYGNNLAVQNRDGIINDKARLDVQSALAGQRGRIEYLNNTLNGLAADGAAGQPQFQQFDAERTALQNAMKNNPLSGYNQQQQDNDNNVFRTSLATSAAVGIGRQVYQQTHNVSQGIQAMRDHLQGVEGINERQLIQLEGEVTYHLRGLDAGYQQQNQQARDQADSVILQSKATGAVPLTQLESTAQSLDARRLYAKAADVRAQSLNQQYQPAILGGSAQEATDALNTINAQAARAVAAGPAGATTSPATATIQGAILGQESGNRDNPGTSITGAKGPGQVQPATFKQYAQPGESIDNPSDNRAVSNRIVADYAKRYNGDAARVAVAYFSGPGNVAGPGSPTPYINDRADPTGKTTSSYVSDVLGRVGSPDNSSADGSPVVAYKALLKDTYTAYNQHAQMLWTGMKSAWDGQVQPTPQEMSDLRLMAPNITDPKLREEMQDRLQVEGGRASFAKMPLAQQQDMIASGNLLAQQGGLGNVQRQTLAALGDQVKHQTALAKDDPVTYGQRYIQPDAKGGLTPLTPLDTTNPQNFVAGIQARQAIKGAAQNMDPAVGDMPFTATDRAQVVTALQQGQGPQVASILNGITQTLKPGEMNALLSDKEVSTAITGMVRSGDPGKYNAAMSFMDTQSRQNPLAFDKQFPGGDRDLALWQSYRAFMTPDQIAQKAMQANDPSTITAKNNLGKTADELLKKVQPSDVVSKFATSSWLNPLSWGTSPGAPMTEASGMAGEVLKGDYANAFKDMYQETGDKNVSDDYAMKQVQKKWGATQIGGNRVMAYPPEKYYPEVNGSHDWLAKQLDQFIGQQAGPVAADQPNLEFGSDPFPAHSDAEQRSINVARGPRSLVADSRTEAEISAGKLPSYHIVVKDPSGRDTALTGPDGRLVRFFGDPSGPQAVARDAFTRGVMQKHDLDELPPMGPM